MFVVPEHGEGDPLVVCVRVRDVQILSRSTLLLFMLTRAQLLLRWPRSVGQV